MRIEKQRAQSTEVYHALDRTFSLQPSNLKELVGLASKNLRKRARLCAHRDPSDQVQQMFIAHKQGTYIRPHKHLNKDESMLILEGSADYIIFNEFGEVESITSMASCSHDAAFFTTIGPGVYHSLRIKSEWLIFLEVTKGPFVKEETIFADWSPDESDLQSVNEFMQKFDARNPSDKLAE